MSKMSLLGRKVEKSTKRGTMKLTYSPNGLIYWVVKNKTGVFSYFQSEGNHGCPPKSAFDFMNK